MCPSCIALSGRLTHPGRIPAQLADVVADMHAMRYCFELNGRTICLPLPVAHDRWWWPWVLEPQPDPRIIDNRLKPAVAKGLAILGAIDRLTREMSPKLRSLLHRGLKDATEELQLPEEVTLHLQRIGRCCGDSRGTLIGRLGSEPLLSGGRLGLTLVARPRARLGACSSAARLRHGPTGSEDVAGYDQRPAQNARGRATTFQVNRRIPQSPGRWPVGPRESGLPWNLRRGPRRAGASPGGGGSPHGEDKRTESGPTPRHVNPDGRGGCDPAPCPAGLVRPSGSEPTKRTG